MGITHIEKNGAIHMVDIGEKQVTKREAIAQGKIYVSKECLSEIKKNNIKKGDVLCAARIAGIMGAKRTSDIIPLCHQLNLTKVDIDFQIIEEESSIYCECRALTDGKTGVEMEALLGVELALLTIYDMCKAVDKSMKLCDIYLKKKSGGKSGEYKNEW